MVREGYVPPGEYVDFLREKADQGDLEACYTYGYAIFEGEDVVYLPIKGIQYLKKASEGGLKKATLRLMEICEIGFEFADVDDHGNIRERSFPSNPDKAEKYRKLAEEQN
jgi:TPR repeat protein